MVEMYVSDSLYLNAEVLDEKALDDSFKQWR